MSTSRLIGSALRASRFVLVICPALTKHGCMYEVIPQNKEKNVCAEKRYTVQ